MSSVVSEAQNLPQGTASTRGLLKQTPAVPSRMLDMVLCALLPWEALTFREIPVTEIAGLLLLGVVLFRAPHPGLRNWGLKILGVLFLFVAFVSTYLVNDVDGLRRLGHLGVWVGLMFVIASGRVSYVSAARGLGIGVGIGAVSGLLGVNLLNDYFGRLTGLFGEPNLGGMIIIAYGLIAVSAMGSPVRRWTFIALCLVALALTLSRTSWMAAIVAALWIGFASKVRPWASVVIMATALPFLLYLVEAVKNLPIFESRAGSDLLREEILEAEEVMISQNPLLGHGAGSAIVNLGIDRYFFHNSYWALRAEFGWIGLAIIAALIVSVFMKLVLLPGHGRNKWLEGAVIAVLACAINLGEVLLALQCSVVLGAALAWIRVQKTGMLEVPLSYEGDTSRANS